MKRISLGSVMVALVLCVFGLALWVGGGTNHAAAADLVSEGTVRHAFLKAAGLDTVLGSAEEFRAAISAVSQIAALPESVRRAGLKNADRNADGVVDWFEFYDFILAGQLFLSPATSGTASSTSSDSGIATSGGTGQGVVGRVFAGYQGWFRCAGDGAPLGVWYHWAYGPTPRPGNLNFEIWPNVQEYTAPLFNTLFANLGNGAPPQLFTSYHQLTTDRHFSWMREYGIEGAAVQRFAVHTSSDLVREDFDQVLMFARNSAEAHDRSFYVMYDLSGFPADRWADNIKHDWETHIVNGTSATSSSAYAREGGKAVVAIWGIGWNHAPGTAAETLELINWFKSNNCYVIGGVPPKWRTGDGKSGFGPVYEALDMISPWVIGQFGNEAGADNWKESRLIPDQDYCNARGIAYQPVIFPGFAWSNWNGPPRNRDRRNQGQFMWRQVHNVRDAGIDQAFIAMFDEYDEATAIAKAATDSSMIPTNQYFLTLSADGVFVSSDFYLRLAGAGTRVIKGLEPNTESVPIPLSVGPDWFRTGLEYDTSYTYDPVTTWENTVESQFNVGAHPGDAAPVCIKVLDQPARTGRGSILVRGAVQSEGASSIYFRVFDVDIPINANTKLSYWTYPQDWAGRHVTIDLVMTDGSMLRDSGALDQNGVSMHPAAGRGRPDRWNQVICNIGQWLEGETIDRIVIGFEHDQHTGPFVCWIDDIEITDNFPASTYKFVNKASSTALTATDIADGSPAVVEPDAGDRSQTWRVDQREALLSRIDLTGAGKALEATGGSGGSVQLWSWEPQRDEQHWHLAPAGHLYAVRSAQSPDSAMTAGDSQDGAAVTISPWTGSDWQLWRIQPHALDEMPLGLRHRYTFNEEPGSPVLEDVVGSAHGLPSDPQAFTGAGEIVMQPTPEGGYVTLPTHLLTGFQDVTVELWTTWDGPNPFVNLYQRIFDFGQTEGAQPGIGVESHFNIMPNPLTFQRMTFQAQGSATGTFTTYAQVEHLTPLLPLQETHLVIVWDSRAGLATLYVDGQVSASGPLFGRLSDINFVNNYLGRSVWEPGEAYYGGALNDFRIYDRAVAAADIAASFAAGADNDGALTRVDMHAPTMTLLAGDSIETRTTAIFARRRKDVTHDDATTYQSSNAAVAAVGSAGRIVGIAEGTAVITVRYQDRQDQLEFRVLRRPNDPEPAVAYHRIVARHSGQAITTPLHGAGPLRQFPAMEHPRQLWRLEEVDGASYRIVNKLSGWVMDAAGEDDEEGHPVIRQREWTGAANQMWKIELAGDSYRLIAGHTGKAAEVAEASPDNGAHLRQATWSGGEHQLFDLIEVEFGE